MIQYLIEWPHTEHVPHRYRWCCDPPWLHGHSLIQQSYLAPQAHKCARNMIESGEHRFDSGNKSNRHPACPLKCRDAEANIERIRCLGRKNEQIHQCVYPESCDAQVAAQGEGDSHVPKQCHLACALSQHALQRPG